MGNFLRGIFSAGKFDKVEVIRVGVWKGGIIHRGIFRGWVFRIPSKRNLSKKLEIYLPFQLELAIHFNCITKSKLQNFDCSNICKRKYVQISNKNKRNMWNLFKNTRKTSMKSYLLPFLLILSKFVKLPSGPIVNFENALGKFCSYSNSGWWVLD